MRISTGDVRISRRRIRLATLLAAAGLSALVGVAPVAAQDAAPADEPVAAPLGPVVAPDPAVDPEDWLVFEADPESDYELPDPLEFDLSTTTYTELAWVRTDLLRTQFHAVVFDIAAAGQLAEARALTVARTAERDEKLGVLEVLTYAVQSAAIDGFLNDSDAQATELFAPTLETIGNADLSEFTTIQLVSARDAARVEYEAAEAALAEAVDLESRAEDAKATTAAAVVAEGERIIAFEERVEQHAKVDAAADRAADANSEEVDLGSVAGYFNVNVVLEDALDALIAHARADGIEFRGGAYRTVEAQIALRLAHCGGAVPPGMSEPDPDASPEDQAAAAAEAEAWRNYVIYEAPPGSCSPPTAIPGNSEHQLGLAVDFADSTDSILTWESPEFAWLVLNGADFGFVNLPSEAWHWSTTGH